MSDKKQLKIQGLRFARSLQMLVKMVNMFSADHKSAADMLRRSYDLLNPMLKQARYLTIGFVDQRILLNNILTAEDSLKPLENEFLKRGIGAISFDAGITLAAFSKAIGAISTNPKVIEESGGLMPFLETRQLEFVRVFPAVKNEIRNEDGDTVLEMGSEEYLISKALTNIHPASSQGIEAILGHLETGSGRGEGAGSGGFPAGNVGLSSENGGGGVISAGSGNGEMVAMGPNTGNVGGGAGSMNGLAASGSLGEVQRLAEQKFDASLRNPDEDPQKAYIELAKVLSGLRPDHILSHLGGAVAPTAAPQKEEVTAEVFEETALRWAMRRLSATPVGEDAVVVEEQIFRVLMRSLQTTHAASRLAQKLAEFAREYALPKKMFERLQQEVRWLTLTPQGKLRELLSMEHFSASEFRRGLDLIKEFMRLGSPEEAIALGTQYFAVFEDYASIRIEEVGRIPELLSTLSGVQGEFWAMAEDRLTQALRSRSLNQLIHVQVVNALVALARVAATYEDFALVKRIGMALEDNGARDIAGHEVCCCSARPLLLQPSAADRIAEIFLEKKNDSEWIKIITTLLRWANPAAIERIFLRLDNEPLAANRLALIRLLGRIGPAGLAAVRQRLKHHEWYVVRNACKLLGELKDPEIFDQLLPVFGHPDERVQKAALQAVKESRLPGRKNAIAKALRFLPVTLVEDALSELMFQADQEILPSLEEYFQSPVAAGPRAMVRVVYLVAAIPQAPAAEALARISLNEKLDENVRQAAQQALSRRSIGKEAPAQKQEEGPGIGATILDRISAMS